MFIKNEKKIRDQFFSKWNKFTIDLQRENVTMYVKK